MFEILAIPLGLMGYTSVAFGVGKLTGFLWDPKYEEAGPYLAGAFWPVAITACFPFYVYSLSKRVKLPSVQRLLEVGGNRGRSKAEQKVIEYSQSPTKVLTEIICAKIMTNPENLKVHYDSDNWYGGFTPYQWTDPAGKVVIISRENYNNEIFWITSVIVNKKVVQVSSDRLLKALNSAMKLNKEKVKADEEAAKQLAALEAVESLLLQPETTVTKKPKE